MVEIPVAEIPDAIQGKYREMMRYGNDYTYRYHLPATFRFEEVELSLVEYNRCWREFCELCVIAAIDCMAAYNGLRMDGVMEEMKVRNRRMLDLQQEALREMHERQARERGETDARGIVQPVETEVRDEVGDPRTT